MTDHAGRAYVSETMELFEILCHIERCFNQCGYTQTANLVAAYTMAFAKNSVYWSPEIFGPNFDRDVTFPLFGHIRQVPCQEAAAWWERLLELRKSLFE